MEKYSIEDLKKGKIAICYDKDTIILVIKQLFENDLHFRESDNYVLKFAEKQKELYSFDVYHDESKLINILFMASNMIPKVIFEEAVIVFKDEYLLFSDMKCELKNDVQVIDIAQLYFDDKEVNNLDFEINETVRVKKEINTNFILQSTKTDSYTGIIISYDFINDEYEVAKLASKHETEWISKSNIFKIKRSDEHDQ